MAAVAESVRRLRLIADAAVPAGWLTYTGSPAAGELPAAYLAVAYGGDDRPGIVGSASLQDSYMPNHSGHRWLVYCTASVASGDVRPEDRLAEVEMVFDDFEELLEANRYLDDGVNGPLLVGGSIAAIATHEWQIEPDGTVATVFFTVEVLLKWEPNA